MYLQNQKMMAGLKSHRMRTIFSIYAASYAKVTLPGFLCQKMEQKPWAGEGWLAARAQLASPLNSPGVEVDDKAAVGLIKINSALKENTWKNHIQHQQQEHRGTTAWPLGKRFVTCLAPCSGTRTFSGPCAGMICLVSHLPLLSSA